MRVVRDGAGRECKDLQCIARGREEQKTGVTSQNERWVRWTSRVWDSPSAAGTEVAILPHGARVIKGQWPRLAPW